jgi:hypothetical protein
MPIIKVVTNNTIPTIVAALSNSRLSITKFYILNEALFMNQYKIMPEAWRKECP